MQILFRLLLVLGLVWTGFVLGTFIGGHYFLPRDGGLAAAPMALGYGLLGALITGIPAFVAAAKLSGGNLRRSALLVGAVAVFIMAGLVMRLRRGQKDARDPESAYAGLPAFHLSLEQLVILDPYLSTKTEIDSGTRRWVQTLPDGRLCRGNLSARAHRRIGEALKALAGLDSEALGDCRSAEDAAEQQLVWELTGSPLPAATGALKIAPECLGANPVVARLVQEIRRANLDTLSTVKCD